VDYREQFATATESPIDTPDVTPDVFPICWEHTDHYSRGTDATVWIMLADDSTHYMEPCDDYQLHDSVFSRESMNSWMFRRCADPRIVNFAIRNAELRNAMASETEQPF
jgi:hypothetical protein